MAYLVRSIDGGIYELRDGALPTDPMRVLKPGIVVVFKHLPASYAVPGDNQIEIREQREAIPLGMPEHAAPAAAAHPVPHKKHEKKR